MSLATIDECYGWLGVSDTYSDDDTLILGIIMASVDRMFADFLGFSPAQATRTEYYPARVNLTQRDQFVDGWERSGGNKVVPIDRYRNERRALLLRHLPVRSIVSVYENTDAWMTATPDFSAPYLLAAGSDYYLDQEEDGISKTGFLIRSTGPWTAAERCIKVTYVGGYSDLELAGDYGVLKHAYLQQVQISYNETKIHRMAGKIGSIPGLLASESLGDWSASYDTLTNAKLYGMQSRLAPGVAAKLEGYINWSMFMV